MGVSKSITAHVSFSRPSLVYQTGEQVTGFIYFRNKRKKYRFKKLFLEFIGELEYLKETTELTNDGIGNYRTQNQTIREKIQLINNRHLVLYPSNNEVIIENDPIIRFYFCIFFSQRVKLHLNRVIIHGHLSLYFHKNYLHQSILHFLLNIIS